MPPAAWWARPIAHGRATTAGRPRTMVPDGEATGHDVLCEEQRVLEAEGLEQQVGDHPLVGLTVTTSMTRPAR